MLNCSLCVYHLYCGMIWRFCAVLDSKKVNRTRSRTARLLCFEKNDHLICNSSIWNSQLGIIGKLTWTCSFDVPWRSPPASATKSLLVTPSMISVRSSLWPDVRLLMLSHTMNCSDRSRSAWCRELDACTGMGVGIGYHRMC